MITVIDRDTLFYAYKVCMHLAHTTPLKEPAEAGARLGLLLTEIDKYMKEGGDV